MSTSDPFSDFINDVSNFGKSILDPGHSTNITSNIKSARSTYPPYDIAKISDTKFTIEMAVAGFKKEEIVIEKNGSVLIIEGKTASISEKTHLYKGIATRSFVKRFTLDSDVEVLGSTLKDGILVIELEKIIPENKKKKIIEIN